VTRRVVAGLVLVCFAAVAAAAAPEKPGGESRKGAKTSIKSDKSSKIRKSGKTRKSSKGARAAVRKRAAKSTSKWFTAPADAASSPAFRYGQLSQADCEAELTTRGIGFVRETGAGILAPVRLNGGLLHGVVFRTDQPEAARATSHWEIGDCRLVLAMDDFAAILARHDIVEVRHYSMYRPPGKSWPADQLATRHPGALALDAGRFIAKDGSVLDVDKDFHGAIDAATCGDGAGPRPVTPAATELRAILCEAVAARLFNVVLTPNYNRPHHNHFHLEVTAGVKWFLVH
jgi:hypothetical protein